MKASETTLMDFLRTGVQFEIPIYQRTYSWTVQQCKTLWDDVVRAGGSDRVGAHFIGSIVHISKGQSNLTSQEPLLVIDGQQRLTSVTLLIHALASELAKLPASEQQPLDGYSPTKLHKRFLINDDEDDDRRYKLLLTQTDRSTLIALLDNRPRPEDHSLLVTANHEWFCQAIQDYVRQGGDLAVVCQGLAKLMVVDIALARDQENPQLIFESMNSTGKELSQADLIRNYVLMGAPNRLQRDLYEKYWRPMELGFGQSAYATQFDAFVRNYLTMKTGVTPKRDEVYEAFKKHSRNLAGSDGDINAPDHLHKVLGGLRDHAGYYCRIALGRERDASLRDAFADFNELKADTAYPALLEFYNDYEDGVISRDDFVEVIRVLESYVFRRAVCGIPTNSLKLTFQSLAKTLDKSNYLDSLAANLLSLGTYKKFPNDETFAAALHRFDAYNFKRRLYLLRRLENWATKEPAQVGQYTIEHILPQNPDLSPAWRESLGAEWERVQGEWLHSLGNLTLTGYNSEYSDRPFPEKRDIRGGFRDSPLRLNKSLRDLAVWDESAIMDRGTELAQRAVEVWSRPSMPEGVAVAALTSGPQYGVDNFEHLRSPHIREMYDALVRELRALDSTIAIEYRKVHIDFAANGTFMDLVPQAGGLRIQLHVPYEELDDPREICADVSDISRWGTGETRFLLASYDELPYSLGLIRQAFDRQLDVE